MLPYDDEEKVRHDKKEKKPSRLRRFFSKTGVVFKWIGGMFRRRRKVPAKPAKKPAVPTTVEVPMRKSSRISGFGLIIIGMAIICTLILLIDRPDLVVKPIKIAESGFEKVVSLYTQHRDRILAVEALQKQIREGKAPVAAPATAPVPPQATPIQTSKISEEIVFDDNGSTLGRLVAEPSTPQAVAPKVLPPTPQSTPTTPPISTPVAPVAPNAVPSEQQKSDDGWYYTPAPTTTIVDVSAVSQQQDNHQTVIKSSPRVEQSGNNDTSVILENNIQNSPGATINQKIVMPGVTNPQATSNPQAFIVVPASQPQRYYNPWEVTGYGEWPTTVTTVGWNWGWSWNWPSYRNYNYGGYTYSQPPRWSMPPHWTGQWNYGSQPSGQQPTTVPIQNNLPNRPVVVYPNSVRNGYRHR